MGVTRGQLEDIRHQALNALTSVREELQGAGGISFEESQMMVNSGIDGCEQTLNHQCQVINHVLELDGPHRLGGGQVAGDLRLTPATAEAGEADRRLASPETC